MNKHYTFEETEQIARKAAAQVARSYGSHGTDYDMALSDIHEWMYTPRHRSKIDRWLASDPQQTSRIFWSFVAAAQKPAETRSMMSSGTPRRWLPRCCRSRSTLTTTARPPLIGRGRWTSMRTLLAVLRTTGRRVTRWLRSWISGEPSLDCLIGLEWMCQVTRAAPPLRPSSSISVVLVRTSDAAESSATQPHKQ